MSDSITKHEDILQDELEFARRMYAGQKEVYCAATKRRFNFNKVKTEDIVQGVHNGVIKAQATLKHEGIPDVCYLRYDGEWAIIPLIPTPETLRTEEETQQWVRDSLKTTPDFSMQVPLYAPPINIEEVRSNFKNYGIHIKSAEVTETCCGNWDSEGSCKCKIQPMEKDKGLRFNQGKTRYDLVPTFAQEQYAKVLTKGAEKYAERNWELGMKWSKVLASLERHLQAIKRGEDYDPETGLLHSAHVMCNAGFLTEYYKIYPQGDDRPHNYLNRPKIGLDIDEVLADWVGHWTAHHGQEVPETWNFDRDIKAKFDSLAEDKEFWLSIPVKTKPSDIHFEPHCYITSRSIPQEWTEEWLDKNGFPTMPVYSIGHGESKVDVAKKSGIEIYVDDRYENFVELNNAGIFTYLFDAPHNKRYDVGFRRIKNLNEI